MDHCKGNDEQTDRRNWGRLWKLGIIAMISAIWLAYRSGTKPSRLVYPCQQTALSNITTFKTLLLASLPTFASLKSIGHTLKPIALIGGIVLGSVLLTNNSIVLNNSLIVAVDDDYTRVPLNMHPNSAILPDNASDIFVVQNATGLEGSTDSAINALLELMSSNGLEFYAGSSTPVGLIGNNDVVILKVNGQWNYRGGTNTDLVSGVIKAIIDHPDGFTGEIVIADNGQGLGNMDFASCNAFYHNQSMEEVASLFPSYNVSTFLWDDLRRFSVGEYDEGDLISGYVLSETWDAETELFVSYPKFRTVHGTYISYKFGVWNEDTGYDSDRLKVINMPVMKSHFRYGVTGCIKNFMGLPKGQIVTDISYDIPHEHFSIGLGGMGTLMVETRAPILNILDMIWVNAHPMESSSRRGPWSTYTSARFTDVVGASQDPVSLDYWASKNVLCQTADYLNYTEYSSLDPDYAPLSNQYYGIEPMDESFHNYLNRTMKVLNNGGFQATMDIDEMNVYIAALSNHPIPQTTPSIPPDNDGVWLQQMVVVVPISIALVVFLVVIIFRRR